MAALSMETTAALIVSRVYDRALGHGVVPCLGPGSQQGDPCGYQGGNRALQHGCLLVDEGWDILTTSTFAKGVPGNLWRKKQGNLAGED